MILDEPTAGIDIHSKSEIHKLIGDFAKKGMAVVLISSEMSELLSYSDRILVMNDNQIIGELTADATQEEIMRMIMKDKAKNVRGMTI
jgi:inositol transport system ATP-binding protein